MKRAALEEAFMQSTTLRAIEGHYVVSAFGCRTVMANALRKKHLGVAQLWLMRCEKGVP